MENFEFFAPTRMMFGKNTHQQVGKIVEECGFKKVLVHFGGVNARESGLLDAVAGAFKAEGIQCVTLRGIQVNPTLAKTKEGVELYLREGVNLVLAVGGGSVIDLVKCIADGAGNPDTDAWTYFRQGAVPARILPMDVILTLSASGNEMSASYVIANEEDRFKHSSGSVTHRPLFSICNPELACTVSKYQTACNTVDIVMHTLERYFSRTRDTGLTGHIAEALLRSTVEAGKIAGKEPDNYEARAALMWGGSLSHNGLTRAGRGFFMQMHQLERELFGMYSSIAHGAGLATLWPSWVRFVCPDDVNRFVRYAVRVWSIDMDSGCPMNTALAGIRATKDFYKSLGMPSSSKEFGVEEERLEKVAEKCTNIGKRTLPDIREPGKEEMMEIYRMTVGE